MAILKNLCINNMKAIIKKVANFIKNEEAKRDKEQSLSLLMELTLKDRDLIDAIDLKDAFDNSFDSFLAQKKEQLTNELKRINDYENN